MALPRTRTGPASIFWTALIALALTAALAVAAPGARAQADAFDDAEAEMRAVDDGAFDEGAFEDSDFDDEQFFAEDDVNDPFEGVNRFFFDVNLTLDKYLLKPVAKAYEWTVPEVIRNVARNMIQNLESPVIFANDVLQGEFERALTTTMRFSINSTFGFLGAADIAQEMGLERHTEDFGQTLGVYGAPEGPYLFLPALGPAPPRDLAGRVVDTAFNPLRWIGGNIRIVGTEITVDPDMLSTAAGAIAIVDARAQNLEALDEIERTSVDFYATIRSLYRQSRQGAIRNGRIDVDDLPDLEEFE